MSNYENYILQARLKNLGKDQGYLAGVFKRSEARISHAFKGKAPGLLSKIKKHIELLESKAA